jgi:hypothetical protein
MNNTKQSFLVFSIVMFFITTAVLMLIIIGDNRAMYVEEAYMLALSIFAGYLTAMLAFLTWKHYKPL